MGLGLDVGVLVNCQTEYPEGYEELTHQFDLINILLTKNGLPQHTEPEDIPTFDCSMGSYSNIHYLRRIAAHLLVNDQMPEPILRGPADDPILDRYYSKVQTHPYSCSSPWKRFDHLLLHSDCEGFYLPIEFDEVLKDVNQLGVEGGLVGSSQKLLAECFDLGEQLGLPMELNNVDKIFDKISEATDESESWNRYRIETERCLTLMEAAEHSVKYGAAIVFG